MDAPRLRPLRTPGSPMTRRIRFHRLLNAARHFVGLHDARRYGLAPSMTPPWNFNPPPMFGLRLNGDDAWRWVLSKPRPGLDAHTRALLAQLPRPSLESQR